MGEPEPALLATAAHAEGLFPGHCSLREELWPSTRGAATWDYGSTPGSTAASEMCADPAIAHQSSQNKIAFPLLDIPVTILTSYHSSALWPDDMEAESQRHPRFQSPPPLLLRRWWLVLRAPCPPAGKQMFREDHALAHRCVESAEIEKHPQWVPVIVGKVSGSQRVDIDKRKDLVPSDLSVARSTWIVRTGVQLPSEKAVFLVDKTVPQSSLTVCGPHVRGWPECSCTKHLSIHPTPEIEKASKGYAKNTAGVGSRRQSTEHGWCWPWRDGEAGERGHQTKAGREDGPRPAPVPTTASWPTVPFKVHEFVHWTSIQEPSGAGGDTVIRGSRCPHHTSAAATAGSANLGRLWLPEPQEALGGWAATIQGFPALRASPGWLGG
ncbi:hypothetical protein QTO34_002869 [Cnephaeus nilssonii]|uniref:Uncharacterized protein n=1 Tax=Cnephaeus nilssonii TaxID=3371016 RepID=A0AA40HT28_CNENI|nr:hypothetical protein QTO34_002869 [Eptesicus nilssonii]